jgi:tRNA pseudouridine13 synthase
VTTVASPGSRYEPAAWPTALGDPPASGRLRALPEDFQVDEVLGFEADGEGEHLLLRVEKRGANTGWVAGQLARAAGVDAREVGYAGQKDRHALSWQSFTVPSRRDQALDRWVGYEGEGYRVLEARRHGRKLRPGAHRGNRFRIRLREAVAEQGALESRAAQVSRLGVPNYFGPQRFGRGGANLERAHAWAATGRSPRARAERNFALSAARSLLFNEVLAERVRRGDWNRLLPGEAAILEGSRSHFVADVIDEVLVERAERMDLHPSGPLWGRGDPPARGEAAELERSVIAGEADLAQLLGAQGLDQERRSLRLAVRGFDLSRDADGLVFSFELPRGTFATAVLHELVRDAWKDVQDSGD